MTREEQPAQLAERLAVVLAADESAPARAREVALRFAATHGLPPARVRHVALAVSEAVTNIVLHAGAGDVELRGCATPYAIELVVADRGLGMRPGPSPGIGQGLHLIAAVADHVEVVERAPGPGLEVRVRFLR